MTYILILVASVIFLCILADKLSDRLGLPALLLFMFIGILFGSDGIVKIPFDDFHIAVKIEKTLAASVEDNTAPTKKLSAGPKPRMA